jgi:tellurite methyltransferase
MEFFERQFQRQAREGELALNPFEELALARLRGEVLDLGCGMGALALAAARKGHTVRAVDASPTAIARLAEAARSEGLALHAELADLSSWEPERPYDSIVAIGLLMFFPRERALALLRSIRERVRPGGVAVVNVLIEGTTWLEPFEPGRRTLFAAGELERAFADWTLLDATEHEFAASGGTLKRFVTLVARKPEVPSGGSASG